MNEELYPLKFTPILKERIWGGNKLKQQLNKSTNLDSVGESWEISDVEENISIISNGYLKGMSLQKLVQDYPNEVLGKKNHTHFGYKFPLLIKFIDAKDDLSIQLHPNDELAKERHNSFGKTEMWYVMQADKDAHLIVGFNQKMDKENYITHLKNKTLTKILNFEKVKPGDTYFIDVGRVHAICSGIMLAEIQQTSDVTYRLYDWDRKDSNGNERQLHTDLALDAIDFNMPDNFKKAYSRQTNRPNELVNCSYFTTNFLPLETTMNYKNTKDSFVIFMCVNGKATFITSRSQTKVQKGETLLIPAVLKEFVIETNKAEFLEVYV